MRNASKNTIKQVMRKAQFDQKIFNILAKMHNKRISIDDATDQLLLLQREMLIGFVKFADKKMIEQDTRDSSLYIESFLFSKQGISQ